jgi:hypothetical protein
MLNEALLKLEQVIDRMIEENHSLTSQIQQVSQERDQLADKLKQLESDNETLLIDGMEQEEKQEQTLDRIKAMLNRFDDSETTPNNTNQETQQTIDL